MIEKVTDCIYSDSNRIYINHMDLGGIAMAIPADNGNYAKERAEQEKRISEVANTGANVQKEVKFNPPAHKEKCIFGEI